MNKWITAVIMLLFSLSLYGESESLSLIFGRTSWNIGIETFSGELPGQYGYLNSSLPDLIKRELELADSHILNRDEISRYRKDILSSERKKLIENLEKSYREKDNLLFNEEDLEEKRDNLVDDISTLRDKLRILDLTEESEVETAQMLPVQWVDSGDDNSQFGAGELSRVVLCRANDLDYLISGSLRKIDDYFRMEITGYSRATDSESLIFSATGTLEDLDYLAVDAAEELRSLILGRAWAGVRIETDNPDALVYSDGELIGVGSAYVNTLHPGRILLEAVGPDESYWSEEADLTALNTLEFTALLSETAKEFVQLTSNPDGADVYIGARWAGTTPLVIPRYSDKSFRITLKAEGFYEKSFTVAPESPDQIAVELEIETISLMEDFDLKKKAFYGSLGRFTLSVAAPVITAGVYSNYISRQNAYVTSYYDPGSTYYQDSEIFDLAKDMERNYYISYGVFWGTIGISSGLLVDVFVKLSRYIKAAEALAE